MTIDGSVRRKAVFPLRLWEHAIPQTDTRPADTSSISHIYLDYGIADAWHAASIHSFEVRELTAGGAVLGVFEDCYYEQETVRMESGDLLVLFTDGLTESLDREGNEFGEERLRDTLTACAHLSADEVRDKVVGQVREWSAGAAQHDDLTFVVMKVK